MVGTPVAVVLADSQDIGDEAMRLIKVDYEILPAAVNFLEAMKPGAPKQWDNQLDGTTVGVSKPFQRGDAAAAFSAAEVKIDHVAVKPVEQHVALELTNSLTWWENDRLNQIYTSQGAHSVRAALSSALRLPMSQVRVVQQGYVGSGYGYRGSLDLPEIHAAIASKLTAGRSKTSTRATRTSRRVRTGRRSAMRSISASRRTAPSRRSRRRSSPTWARSELPPRRAPGTRSRCSTRFPT